MTEHPAAVAIFAATIALSLLGMYQAPGLIERCLFRPASFPRRGGHTIVTSGFVHADLAHLAFNMITFWFFAFPMERRIGTWPFLALYFGGLLLSHGCTWHKHRRSPGYASLGASGAISAVLLAYVVYYPTSTLIILPLPVPIPAALFAVLYIGYSYWASNHPRGRINHDAHLCGALAGLLFVVLLDPGAYRELAIRLFL